MNHVEDQVAGVADQLELAQLPPRFINGLQALLGSWCLLLQGEQTRLAKQGGQRPARSSEDRMSAALRFLPPIILFLGFDPRPSGRTLADQLVACRTARGLSREAAARLLGVDPGTLWKWESGRRTPGGAFLAKIEAFLDADHS